MKREDVDWRILSGALIILVISIALCTSLVIGSFYFEKRMQVEFDRNNAQFKEVSNRYLAVDEEEKLINTYFPKFKELVHNGAVGSEQRLNWVETLRQSGQEMKLPTLNYQIESQKVYMPDFPVVLGKYNLYRSRMTLTMQLLHEGDLLKIIKILDENARGTYSVSSCQLTQMQKTIQDTALQGNISAKCNFDWYTIKPQDGSEIDV